MAVPLLFILGGTLLRAAGPAIAKQLVKMGARKATGKAAQGAAKTVNSNNIGVIKTISRPKSGGAAPKPTPKTSGSGSAKKPTTNKKPATSGTGSGSAAKPSGSGRNAGGRKKPPAKKKPPELKADPSMRLSGAKPKPSGRNTARNNKKPVTGDKAQRGLIVAATALPMFMDTKPTGTATAKDKPVDKSNRATSKGGRGFGEGTYKKKAASGDSFGAAFKKAYGKGVGTKFTHKGKSYTAVKDTDLKKAGVKTLREYLNKKKKKG